MDNRSVFVRILAEFVAQIVSLPPTPMGQTYHLTMPLHSTNVRVKNVVYAPVRVGVDPYLVSKVREKKTLGRLDNMIFFLEDQRMILMNFCGKAKFVTLENRCEDCLLYTFNFPCERCQRFNHNRGRKNLESLSRMLNHIAEKWKVKERAYDEACKAAFF
jgi:hypothetical protein